MKQSTIKTTLALISTILFFILSDRASAVSVNIDTNGPGRVFEGIGAVSAGGTSRLLIDYPEPYRSDILDFLFKPKFGAGFQHLKVEIGSDTPSCAAEPSFARTRAELSAPNYNRGYEYWLMQQAKNRNSAVILDCLQWGAPGWIGNGNFYSQDNADYIVKFLEGARDTWGVNINWVGCWNETPYNRNYLVNMLRPTLDSRGFSNVKIVAPDSINWDGMGSGWDICTAFLTDVQLKNAVDTVASHYCMNNFPAGMPTQTAKNSGKPLWSSEDFSLSGHNWINAKTLCLNAIIAYVEGSITKYEAWTPIDSYYDNMLYSNVGVMSADEPWSGYYIVEPAVWAVAHWTQFAEPGWKFIDSGCGRLTDGGGYVTLKKPDGSGDYSIIIVTGSTGEAITFTLGGGLSQSTLHVWKSDANAQFVGQEDIVPAGGTFSITCLPDSIYSLTTTTGQCKGIPAHPIVTHSNFPDSYNEDFESYSAGVMPKYFADMAGAFETVNRYGGQGKALCQVATQKPIAWPVYSTPDPWTNFGEVDWQDIEVSADALIESSSGNVVLYARATKFNFENSAPDGYALNVSKNGNWYLKQKDTVLASGITSFGAYTWHNLKLRCLGKNIRAFIDGTQVASVTNSEQAAGLVGVGSGWHRAQFDNVNVTVLSLLPQWKMSAAASSWQSGFEPSKAIDDTAANFWCTQWNPYVPLPQSITLKLGSTCRINKLFYLPRQDTGVGSSNGIITGYKVYTSLDGSNWIFAASGNWASDKSQKSAEFAPVNASYVKLEATAGYGGYACADEIDISGFEVVPHKAMTISAQEGQAGFETKRIIDDTRGSFWLSPFDPCRPSSQAITLNFGNTYRISKLWYLPRQDSVDVNGIITDYEIFTSANGEDWASAAKGNWTCDKLEKSVILGPLNASFVKIQPFKGFGNYVSADEINIAGVEINAIPHEQVTVSATSFQSGYEPSKSIDDTLSSFWCTRWDPYVPLPQSLVFYLKSLYRINKLWYLPRQDSGGGDLNGVITGYKLYTSLDGRSWIQVGAGDWGANKIEKFAEFLPITCSYLKLEATAGYGGYACADEIQISGSELKLAEFCEHWLHDSHCEFDYNNDSDIDFLDYALFEPGTDDLK